jgi:hypothetical protein
VTATLWIFVLIAAAAALFGLFRLQRRRAESSRRHARKIRVRDAQAASDRRDCLELEKSLRAGSPEPAAAPVPSDLQRARRSNAAAFGIDPDLPVP